MQVSVLISFLIAVAGAPIVAGLLAATFSIFGRRAISTRLWLGGIFAVVLPNLACLGGAWLLKGSPRWLFVDHRSMFVSGTIALVGILMGARYKAAISLSQLASIFIVMPGVVALDIGTETKMLSLGWLVAPLVVQFTGQSLAVATRPNIQWLFASIALAVSAAAVMFFGSSPLDGLLLIQTFLMHAILCCIAFGSNKFLGSSKNDLPVIRVIGTGTLLMSISFGAIMSEVTALAGLSPAISLKLLVSSILLCITPRILEVISEYLTQERKPTMIPLGKVLVFALAGSMTLSQCTRLQPSGALEPAPPVSSGPIAGSVAVSLDFQSLGIALGAGSHLTVRVFRLVKQSGGEEICADQEGADRDADLAAMQGSFTLDQLTVGRKEIQVGVISDLGDQIGFGTLRLSVSLGINEVADPLMMNWLTPEQRIRDLGVAFDVSFIAPGFENEVIYSDVESIVQTHCSASCHNTSGFEANGKLDMSAFPFRSGLRPTQQEIVSMSLQAMVDLTYPMPKRGYPRVPDDERQKISDWFDSGLPATHTTMDQYNPLAEVVKIQWKSTERPESGEVVLTRTDGMTFGGSLRAMRIGFRCDLTVIVLGPQGVELKRAEFPGTLIRGIGAFQKDVLISYVPPTVRIPIVINE